MKHLLIIACFCSLSLSWSQSKLEMTPQGFAPVEAQTPNKPLEKLMALSKSWAAYYNKNGYDVFDVTDKSLTIGAVKENAYFYRNFGVQYDYNIKYTLKINFTQNQQYILTFTVNEIYANEVLTQTKISDFYTPNGKLKDDFEEVKPSLESTVNKIIKSYSNYLVN